MIGGYDIFEAIRTSHQDIDFLLRGFHAFWPTAVIETADGTKIMSVPDALKNHPNDFFVYESDKAREAWTRDGCTPEYDSSMIAVTIKSAGISFVVNELDSPTHKSVIDMIAALKLHQKTYA